jgi:hypothetical protein
MNPRTRRFASAADLVADDLFTALLAKSALCIRIIVLTTSLLDAHTPAAYFLSTGVSW